MKRAFAIGMAIVSGVALAGIVAAPLSMWLPEQFRRAETLGVLTILVVGLTIWAFWGVSASNKQ